MSRGRWHILRDGACLTLARRLPPVFDVAGETRLPDAARARIAHQIRQDMWRALREVRGFSPVVEVRREAGSLAVRAGGRVAGPCNRALLSARIADLLACPSHRARWVRHAGGQA